MSADSTPATIADQAMLVLVAHQRLDLRGCLCGWSELGRSHAVHQVAMLTDAGLLAPERPDLPVPPQLQVAVERVSRVYLALRKGRPDASMAAVLAVQLGAARRELVGQGRTDQAASLPPAETGGGA